MLLSALQREATSEVQGFSVAENSETETQTPDSHLGHG